MPALAGMPEVLINPSKKWYSDENVNIKKIRLSRVARTISFQWNMKVA